MIRDPSRLYNRSEKRVEYKKLYSNLQLERNKQPSMRGGKDVEHAPETRYHPKYRYVWR